MSQTTTSILLPQTTWSSQVANGNSYTVTGNSQPAESYVISPRALQTVNINLSDVNGNIIIFNPYYNSLTNPVYYQSPNVIVPKPPTAPSTNTNTTTSTTSSTPPPSGSSDPAYQS